MHIPSDSRSTILYLDDDADMHRLVARCLRHRQLSIVTAGSGAEGIERAKGEHPHLILLDVDLPDMTGFEVIAALQNDPDTVSIPVIFLSSSNSTAMKVRAFDVGAVDYITRPFECAELRARASSALRMQWLVTMLARRAQVDGLTGLWNRTYLDHRLGEAISVAVRHDWPLALVMCDLDFFKRVNDASGHAYGDSVLHEFANLLMRAVRQGDVACRYGGEEFAIIAPNTGAEEGRAIAERCRSMLAAMKWPQRDDLVITASFGVSDLTRIRGKTPESLIASADEALYEAKREGRNRCVMARAEAGSAASSASGEAAGGEVPNSAATAPARPRRTVVVPTPVKSRAARPRW